MPLPQIDEDKASVPLGRRPEVEDDPRAIIQPNRPYRPKRFGLVYDGIPGAFHCQDTSEGSMLVINEDITNQSSMSTPIAKTVDDVLTREEIESIVDEQLVTLEVSTYMEKRINKMDTSMPPSPSCFKSISGFEAKQLIMNELLWLLVFQPQGADGLTKVIAQALSEPELNGDMLLRHAEIEEERAAFLFKLRKYSAALKWSLKASHLRRRLNVTVVDGYITIARILSSENDYLEELLCYEKALTCCHNQEQVYEVSSRMYSCVGLVREQQGKHNSALSYYYAAIELCERHSELWLQLCTKIERTLRSSGKSDFVEGTNYDLIFDGGPHSKWVQLPRYYVGLSVQLVAKVKQTNLRLQVVAAKLRVDPRGHGTPYTWE